MQACVLQPLDSDSSIYFPPTRAFLVVNMVSRPWLTPSPPYSVLRNVQILHIRERAIFVWRCDQQVYTTTFCLYQNSHLGAPTRLDPANPPGRYDAPRPCTAAQVENRNSMSSVASSRYQRSSRESMSSKRSSVASYSSISSYGSNFETAPAFVKTPWELERYKRHSIPRRTRPVGLLPPHVFQELPREIYDCILQQLQFLHFDAASQVCPSCYLRDVRNLGLTSRAWGKAAREQL